MSRRYSLGLILSYFTIMKSIALIIILIFNTYSEVVYSQNFNNQDVKVAANIFYKKYLPIFGYPDESNLQELRPYLSQNLHSLIENERRRMKSWTAKNPDMKPPVIEDLFLCNHYEPPSSFRVGETITRGTSATVTLYFDYAENGKIYETCKTKSSFVQRNGKWLLNNITFDQGIDLRTLLLRKNYAVMPK